MATVVGNTEKLFSLKGSINFDKDKVYFTRKDTDFIGIHTGTYIRGILINSNWSGIRHYSGTHLSNQIPGLRVLGPR